MSTTMAIKLVRLLTRECRCEQCKHKWVPRLAQIPVICPKCKRQNWNEPRRKKEASHA